MHYGIASYGLIHRIETIQIGTQILFAVIGAGALGNYGLGIGRALQSGSHQVTVERAAPVFMAVIAGLFALLITWQAARLIEAYLYWRIYVDAEAFEPIKARFRRPRFYSEAFWPSFWRARVTDWVDGYSHQVPRLLSQIGCDSVSAGWLGSRSPWRPP